MSNLQQAMADLRAGRITPDEYRAIMRASKAQNGQSAHERLRNLANAADIRNHYNH